MNKVIIIGRIASDPTLEETNNGIKVCKFNLAVPRNYSNSDGEKPTDFFRITCWRGLAETVSKYAHKGNKIAVTGSIELRNYEDSQGVKRTTVDIVAQEVEFLTPRTEGATNGDFGSRDERKTRTSSEERRTPRYTQIEAFDDDENIPFKKTL